MTVLSVKYTGNGGAIPDQPLARPVLLLQVSADLIMDTTGWAGTSWTLDSGAVLFSDTSGSVWERAAYGGWASLYAGLQPNDAFCDDVIAVIDDPASAVVFEVGAIDESIEPILDLPKLLAITEAQVAELEAAFQRAGIDPDTPDVPDDVDFVLIFNAGL
ncbi:hypothetical protein CcrC1_gp116 [Caulobacter phage C1]|nr:hypothetical protein CcrC1_gp116 [Caulobacter phage C1]UTU08344.1 hypothetical protein CcrC2_gp116 [Caulobacter phage C2]UTU08863.1 hypothetical protein CcrJ4_gp112 [Caulobacter phage J4]UTU09418.1 hypothetical protein CcrBL47_gp132 [Caulobacter phage BL47]UTU09978.1 hypothetical protein CcrRB23_gp116 [Caulobacter phage RB23]WGN97003.1 hypothetical protein [Bertelyvirus sp.]